MMLQRAHSSMALFASILTQINQVQSHRSLPPGITCGSQFSSPDTALVIPNPAISWANYGIYSCDHPIHWFEATVDQDQTLHHTVTVPVIDRFENTKMSVAFVGPGLSTDFDDVSFANVPQEVKQYAMDSNMGMAVSHSPQDQSSCGHLASSMMREASTVKDGRCHFYEPFGGSNHWVVLDEALVAPASGTFKIAMYESNGNTAKASFACCDWPEDFITAYSYPETACEVCGTDPAENPAWSSLFFEHKTMAEYGGYPPLQNCLTDDTAIALPENCPILGGDEVIQQPESCALGCSNDGECHSHNIFGECTHVLDWTLTPKFGDATVNQIIIFKGDKIRFIHETEDQLAHNLFELSDEAALDSCDFDGSSSLATVEEVKIGHDITFDKAGTFYFTCSIGCNAEMPGMPGMPEMPDAASMTRNEDNALCHCQVGQKLTVEVKDATEGMKCHNHKYESSNSHTSGTDGEASPLACPDGLVNARAVNSPTYGSNSESECSEQCTSPVALSFMAGVELGSCVEIGYKYNPQVITIRPQGSPMDVEVTVTSNIMEGNGHGDHDESYCHCHSYEQIVCPENETPSDTLYAEHIDEINEYCQGVLDGSDKDCPYKCFQPIEVLHLHYLECSGREVDEMYEKVNATGLCHVAAMAPDDTTECPEVELGVKSDKENVEPNGEGGDGVGEGTENVDGDNVDSGAEENSCVGPFPSMAFIISSIGLVLLSCT